MTPAGGSRPWPKVPIRSDRLLLRRPKLSDVPELVRICRDPTIRWGVHLMPSPYRPIHARTFVASRREAFGRRSSLALAITLPDSGALAGMIELHDIVWSDRRAELGYWVTREHRGRGYATEAVATVCDVAFGTMRLHRVFAGVLARNDASARVLRKSGFLPEGRSVGWAHVDGGWIDELRFGRVAPPAPTAEGRRGPRTA